MKNPVSTSRKFEVPVFFSHVYVHLDLVGMRSAIIHIKEIKGNAIHVNATICNSTQ
jgi:hypothetical protein